MRTARLWPLALAAVLGITVVANFWLLWAANDDQRWAFEPDYYRKALAWDSTMAQTARSEQLGWRADIGLTREGQLAVALFDSGGTPIHDAVVRAELIPIAHADRARTVTLTGSRPGPATARVALVYAGLHEIRVTASRASDRFAVTARGLPGGAFRP